MTNETVKIAFTEDVLKISEILIVQNKEAYEALASEK
mgnify:CR=1 FL=1